MTPRIKPDGAVLGPLWLVTYSQSRGFITYADLNGLSAVGIRALVRDARAHFADETAVESVEWKTRGHDAALELHEALVAHGFVPQEPESIMVGDAECLLAGVDLPRGVTLRKVTEERDVLATEEMQGEVFGDPDWRGRAAATLRRIVRGDDLELWVAVAAGKVIAAGRLEPVAQTDFAGLWGGATRAEWRGQGIYRALTARRARSALGRGKTLLHSDSTELSRLILQRAGLTKVSTTTPYVWRRGIDQPAGTLRQPRCNRPSRSLLRWPSNVEAAPACASAGRTVRVEVHG